MPPCLPQAILMYLGSKPDLVRQYSTAQLALVKVRWPLERLLPSLCLENLHPSMIVVLLGVIFVG